MKTQHAVRTLLRSSSILALSGAAVIGMANPGEAAGAVTGFYGGGSTSFSEMARQLFDCYQGMLLAGDGFSISPNNLVKPGQIPKSCTVVSQPAIEGLYAGVGSGSAMNAYLTDNPLELVQGPRRTANPQIWFYPMPTPQPPAIDSFSPDPALNSYPYPQLDFATSDAPLPGTLSKLNVPNAAAFNPAPPWAPPMIAGVNAPSTASFTATYNPANFGNAIQIPLAEAPVAIILNPGATFASPTFPALNIFTGLGPSGSPDSKAGGAIALSTAQLCAIFSGLVIDWSDSTTVLPYLDKLGHSHTFALSATMANFNAFTTSTFPPSGSAYTIAPAPIVIVYRSDDSGTTFVLTNFLQSACPQLDGLGSTSGIYHSIFQTPGASGNTLPNTSFSKLIASVNTYWRANGRGPSYDISTNWIGQQGSQAVAAEVGNTTSAPTHGGYIGYVGADFTSPYSNLGATIAPDPTPWSASLQNESLRFSGHYFPGNSTGTTFIAPSSKSVDLAFAGLAAPAANAAWPLWNLYGITYRAQTRGGVKYGGISQLGLPNAIGSYPIAGTTFMYVYSCYAAPARANTIANFLAWYLGGSVPTLPQYTALNNRFNPGYDVAVSQMLSNNGFHGLHALFATNLLTEYIVPSASIHFHGSTSAISDKVINVDGCTGVTGGGA